MSAIVVYTRPGCHLCAQAMSELRRLQIELGFALSERDIDGDEALQRAYFERIAPVWDHWHSKNGFYHRRMTDLIRGMVPPDARVVEAETGLHGGAWSARLAP